MPYSFIKTAKRPFTFNLIGWVVAIAQTYIIQILFVILIIIWIKASIGALTCFVLNHRAPPPIGSPQMLMLLIRYMILILMNGFVQISTLTPLVILLVMTLPLRQITPRINLEVGGWLQTSLDCPIYIHFKKNIFHQSKF